MAELSDLRQAVINQADERNKARVERERRRMAENYETEKSKRLEAKQAQLDQRLKRLRDGHEQQVQQIKNKKRLTSLVSKQEILQTLYKDTVGRMENQDIDQQLAFLKQMMEEFQGEETILIFGEKTAQAFNEETNRYLQKNFPKAQVSEEVVAGEGGFIIRTNKIDYNYLYSKMVDHVWDRLSHDLAKELFDNAD